MRYMVVEHFRPGRAGEIYRRFDQRGRMLPAGLHCLESWVSADIEICYQLMETDDFGLFAKWTEHWNDVIDFEIVPIITSAEARAKTIASA